MNHTTYLLTTEQFLSATLRNQIMTNAQHDANNEETLDQLDETLDDLADLPDTKPWPAGAYNFSMVVKRQKDKKGAYIVEMTHKETLEVVNANTPEDQLPKVGDKSTVFITTKKKDGTTNEFGQGQLKLVLKPLAELYGTQSIGEIIEQCKGGADMAGVLTVQKSKDEAYPDDKQGIKAIQCA